MIRLFIHSAIIVLLSLGLNAQSGSTIKEFEQKLQGYYDQELINDVTNAIDNNEGVKVWSWDIGDYSMDDHIDLACVVRYSKEKTKQCTVFFFVDINGTLTPVHQSQQSFVESPLEVGVAIKQSSCFVTSKIAQFQWDIIGYRFEHGSFIKVDSFSTSRKGTQTIEVNKDFKRRRNNIHVFSTRNEETIYHHQFVDIPVYHANDLPPLGYQNAIDIDEPEDVVQGAFYWSGLHDATVQIVNSAYDDENWTFTLVIRDDTLVTSPCDTCLKDHIILHISSIFSGVEPKGESIPDISNSRIIIQPDIESPHNSTCKMVGLNSQLPCQASFIDGGYQVKISVPLKALPIPAITDSGIRRIGCTIELIDIDNQYRPEETTRIVSSSLKRDDPLTFGYLTFYNVGISEGFSYQAFTTPLLNTLRALGF